MTPDSRTLRDKADRIADALTFLPEASTDPWWRQTIEQLADSFPDASARQLATAAIHLYWPDRATREQT